MQRNDEDENTSAGEERTEAEVVLQHGDASPESLIGMGIVPLAISLDTPPPATEATATQLQKDMAAREVVFEREKFLQELFDGFELVYATPPAPIITGTCKSVSQALNVLTHKAFIRYTDTDGERLYYLNKKTQQYIRLEAKTSEETALLISSFDERFRSDVVGFRDKKKLSSTEVTEIQTLFAERRVTYAKNINYTSNMMDHYTQGELDCGQYLICNDIFRVAPQGYQRPSPETLKTFYPSEEPNPTQCSVVIHTVRTRTANYWVAAAGRNVTAKDQKDRKVSLLSSANSVSLIEAKDPTHPSTITDKASADKATGEGRRALLLSSPLDLKTDRRDNPAEARKVFLAGLKSETMATAFGKVLKDDGTINTRWFVLFKMVFNGNMAGAKKDFLEKLLLAYPDNNTELDYKSLFDFALQNEALLIDAGRRGAHLSINLIQHLATDILEMDPNLDITTLYDALEKNLSNVSSAEFQTEAAKQACLHCLSLARQLDSALMAIDPDESGRHDLIETLIQQVGSIAMYSPQTSEPVADQVKNFENYSKNIYIEKCIEKLNASLANLPANTDDIDAVYDEYLEMFAHIPDAHTKESLISLVSNTLLAHNLYGSTPDDAADHINQMKRFLEYTKLALEIDSGRRPASPSAEVALDNLVKEFVAEGEKILYRSRSGAQVAIDLLNEGPLPGMKKNGSYLQKEGEELTDGRGVYDSLADELRAANDAQFGIISRYKYNPNEEHRNPHEWVRDATHAVPLDQRIPEDSPVIEANNALLRCLSCLQPIDYAIHMHYKDLGETQKDGEGIRSALKAKLAETMKEMHRIAADPTLSKEAQLEKIKEREKEFNTFLLVEGLHKTGLTNHANSDIDCTTQAAAEELLAFYKYLSSVMKPARTIITETYHEDHHVFVREAAYPVVEKTEKQIERWDNDQAILGAIENPNAEQQARLTFAPLISADDRLLGPQSRKHEMSFVKNAFIVETSFVAGEADQTIDDLRKIEGEKTVSVRSGSSVYVGDPLHGKEDTFKEDIVDYAKDNLDQILQTAQKYDPSVTKIHNVCLNTKLATPFNLLAKWVGGFFVPSKAEQMKQERRIVQTLEKIAEDEPDTYVTSTVATSGAGFLASGTLITRKHERVIKATTQLDRENEENADGSTTLYSVSCASGIDRTGTEKLQKELDLLTRHYMEKKGLDPSQARLAAERHLAGAHQAEIPNHVVHGSSGMKKESKVKKLFGKTIDNAFYRKSADTNKKVHTGKTDLFLSKSKGLTKIALGILALVVMGTAITVVAWPLVGIAGAVAIGAVLGAMFGSAVHQALKARDLGRVSNNQKVIIYAGLIIPFVALGAFIMAAAVPVAGVTIFGIAISKTYFMLSISSVVLSAANIAAQVVTSRIAKKPSKLKKDPLQFKASTGAVDEILHKHDEGHALSNNMKKTVADIASTVQALGVMELKDVRPAPNGHSAECVFLNDKKEEIVLEYHDDGFVLGNISADNDDMVRKMMGLMQLKLSDKKSYDDQGKLHFTDGMFEVHAGRPTFAEAVKETMIAQLSDKPFKLQDKTEVTFSKNAMSRLFDSKPTNPGVVPYNLASAKVAKPVSGGTAETPQPPAATPMVR
ncbi:MAG TPA: hypothetical protein VNC84_06925 [Gammaproteobacteria bacterium]|jgi:hypothetical protein|nr:hypothetical protein [Gammaproteobacteria bacterium]